MQKLTEKQILEGLYLESLIDDAILTEQASAASAAEAAAEKLRRLSRRGRPVAILKRIIRGIVQKIKALIQKLKSKTLGSTQRAAYSSQKDELVKKYEQLKKELHSAR